MVDQICNPHLMRPNLSDPLRTSFGVVRSTASGRATESPNAASKMAFWHLSVMTSLRSTLYAHCLRRPWLSCHACSICHHVSQHWAKEEAKEAVREETTREGSLFFCSGVHAQQGGQAGQGIGSKRGESLVRTILRMGPKLKLRHKWFNYALQQDHSWSSFQVKILNCRHGTEFHVFIGITIYG